MVRIQVDVDEDLLAEATTALGTVTTDDTVNGALRCAVEETRARHERALTALQQIAADGGFDYRERDEQDQ